MRVKIDKADKVFGLYVKELANWTCQKCNRKYDRDQPYVGKSLQCSHFWGRRAESTRFDLDNADALCFGCHQQVEADKQGWYMSYKKKQLGEKGYKLLEIKHNGYKKKDRKMQFLIWQQAYKDLCNEKQITPKKI